MSLLRATLRWALLTGALNLAWEILQLPLYTVHYEGNPRTIAYAVAIVAGISYTTLSEWLNVSVRGSWAYAPVMPQLFGIGLAPILQWLVVPAATLYMLRARDRGTHGA
jgi:hypothetical protein